MTHSSTIADEYILLELLDKNRPFMTNYQCAIINIETNFNVMNAQFNAAKSYNPIDTIKTRLKSAESIVDKLKRKNLPLTLGSIEANLTDIAGVRVICPFEEDIFILSEQLLSHDDVMLLERKDYITKPKGNGYRSLHLIVATPVFTPEGKKVVKVEIQFRTIAMEFWANLEHRLRYKKDLSPELLEDLATEIRECADESMNLDRRMGNLRRKIDATLTLLDS